VSAVRWCTEASGAGYGARLRYRCLEGAWSEGGP